jgi:N-acetylmuramic acid 6-phosphate (MurNAc-6-P) etherase
MPAREIVALMNQEDASIPGVVAGQIDEIALAVDFAVAAFRAGGRLF